MLEFWRATTIYLWSAISNHTGRSVAEGPQQCTVYTLKAITLKFARVRVEFFLFFFSRESGEGKQTRLTDMNNSILVGMLQDWGFLLKAGWSAWWNVSSSCQDLWKRPSPPSHKNTLQIIWGNKAWTERLSQVVKWARAANQAGLHHWHFLLF